MLELSMSKLSLKTIKITNKLSTRTLFEKKFKLSYCKSYLVVFTVKTVFKSKKIHPKNVIFRQYRPLFWTNENIYIHETLAAYQKLVTSLWRHRRQALRLPKVLFSYILNSNHSYMKSNPGVTYFAYAVSCGYTHWSLVKMYWVLKHKCYFDQNVS